MTQRGRAGARPAPPRGRGRDGEETRTPAAPRVDLAAAKARVRAVIEPVITGAGYDLEDLSLSRAGRRHLLRVLVDADGGIGLDDIAVVSREISRALDVADETEGEVLAGEYQLEVSSPGVDRPLTQPRQWRRNVGRLVKVRESVGGRTITGRIVAATDEGVELEVDGRRETLAYEALGPGRVQLEFARVEAMSETELDDLLEDLDDDGVADDADEPATRADDAVEDDEVEEDRA